MDLAQVSSRQLKGHSVLPTHEIVQYLYVPYGINTFKLFNFDKAFGV